jgi:hypothetical protein
MNKTFKCKLIATATNLEHEGFKQFKRSLDAYGWDYEILSHNYIAYGSKMLMNMQKKQTALTYSYLMPMMYL